MSSVVPFPGNNRPSRLKRPGETVSILVLPVIRIERYTEEDGGRSRAARRRRRAQLERLKLEFENDPLAAFENCAWWS